MKRILLITSFLVLLLLAVSGRSYALTVTLLEGASPPLRTSLQSDLNTVILTFGDEIVVIHDSSKSVPGKVLAPQVAALSNLFLIRDHRAAAVITGYQTIYVHGPYQLAIVENADRLRENKRIQMRPVTSSMVVSETGSNLKAEPDPTVEKINKLLDRSKYGSYMELLANNEALPNRYSCADEAMKAHALIVSQFKALNLEVTENQTFVNTECLYSCKKERAANVIAKITGTTRPNEYYIVGAHYDSINDTESPCNDAPGANDNASGVAGVLELARVFSTLNSEASIIFVAFGGEEIDILGSQKYVQELVNNNQTANVKAVVILDMISFYSTKYGIWIEGSDKLESQKAAVAKFVQDTATYTKLKSEFGYAYASSDHVPFLKKDMPGGLLIQMESTSKQYEHLHSSTDVIGHQKLAFAIEILKVAVATLADAGITFPE